MDENNTSSLMKLTLYDRIFKPQTVTLSNGHSVQRRRSRAPLIVLFLVVIIWLSLKMTGFDLHVVITKFRKMVDLLEKIFQPDWTFFPKVISPLIDTIKMSILGTVIGCVLALPVAILSSSNINKSLPGRVADPVHSGSDPDAPDADYRTRLRAHLLARHLLRHNCHCRFYLRHCGKDALRVD